MLVDNVTSHSSYNVTKHNTCSRLTVNAGFVILSILLLIFSLIGVVLNAVVLNLLPRFKIFSCNVQILLRNLASAALIACLVTVIRSMYNAAVIIYGFDAISVNNTICALADGLYVISRLALILSVFGIGAERLYVTLRRNLADDEVTNIGVVFMTIISWSIGVINVAFLIWNATISRYKLCYCYFSFALTSPILATSAGSYAIIELILISIFCLVYNINRSKLTDFTINTAKHNLQERFQMWNNVQTTSMLFPWIVVHCVLYVITLTLIIFVAQSYHESASTSSINCLLLILLAWTLDLIFAPILWIRSNHRFKMIAVWRYPLLKYVFGCSSEDLSRIDKVDYVAVKTAPICSERSKYVVDHHVEPETSNAILEQIWAGKPTK